MNCNCFIITLMSLSSLFLSGCGGPTAEQDWAQINAFLKQPGASSSHELENAINRRSQEPPTSLTSAQHMLLAACFERFDRLQDALDQLQFVTDTAAEAADARLSEGQIFYFKLSDAVKSEKAFRQALQLNPNQVQAWGRLAMLYELRNQIVERDQCFVALDALSALDREQLLLWTCNRRPDSLAHEKNTMLQAFLKTDPRDDVTRLALIDDLRSRGQFEDALALVQSPESHFDSNFKNLLVAEINFDQGQLQDAQLLLDPLNPTRFLGKEQRRFLSARARIDLITRKYQEVVSNLCQMLESEPLDRLSNQMMIQVLHFQMKPADAAVFEARLKLIDQLEDLGQKARATLHREDAQWTNAIVKTAKELGRLELARAWLRTLLAKDPLNQMVQQEMYQLDQQLKSNVRR